MSMRPRSKAPSKVIAIGPVASSQEVIQDAGHACAASQPNAAHPFENECDTNLVQIILLFSIARATNVPQPWSGNEKQGWALFAAMGILPLGHATGLWAEAKGHPAVSPNSMSTKPSALQTGGNMKARKFASASPIRRSLLPHHRPPLAERSSRSMTVHAARRPWSLVNISSARSSSAASARLYGMLATPSSPCSSPGGWSAQRIISRQEARGATEGQDVAFGALEPPALRCSASPRCRRVPDGLAGPRMPRPAWLLRDPLRFNSATGNNGQRLCRHLRKLQSLQHDLAFAMIIGRLICDPADRRCRRARAQEELVAPSAGTSDAQSALVGLLRPPWFDSWAASPISRGALGPGGGGRSR